jgi:hypothetical protein
MRIRRDKKKTRILEKKNKPRREINLPRQIRHSRLTSERGQCDGRHGNIKHFRLFGTKVTGCVVLEKSGTCQINSKFASFQKKFKVAVKWSDRHNTIHLTALIWRYYGWAASRHLCNHVSQTFRFTSGRAWQCRVKRYSPFVSKISTTHHPLRPHG